MKYFLSTLNICFSEEVHFIVKGTANKKQYKYICKISRVSVSLNFQSFYRTVSSISTSHTFSTCRRIFYILDMHHKHRCVYYQVQKCLRPQP